MAKDANEKDTAAQSEADRLSFKETHGYFLADETKGQAFSRIASRRMGQSLTEIRKLETLADKNNYEYTDEQVKKVLSALQDACQKVADRFSGKVKAKESFQI